MAWMWSLGPVLLLAAAGCCVSGVRRIRRELTAWQAEQHAVVAARCGDATTELGELEVALTRREVSLSSTPGTTPEPPAGPEPLAALTDR